MSAEATWPEVRRKEFTGGSLPWLIVLFLGTRLLYLVVVHPDFLLTHPSDELYRGAIAQEIVSGLNMPLADYRADDYSGGSLVVGALAAGFFLLLGPTVFALKLAPLLLFTLALVFWSLTLQRHVSERVAAYFAIIFSVSPPQFTAYSLVAVGFHTESIFFTALSLFLLCEILSAKTPARVPAALLGFTAGFGLWFTYSYGPTLLAVVVFWLWYDEPARLKTRFLYFGAFFVIGFLPWISFNLHHHFSGLVVQGVNVWDHFSPINLVAGLSDYRAFVPYQFFTVFAATHPEDLPRKAVNLCYAVLFLVPILAARFLGPRALEATPANPHPDRIKLAGFGILYLCIFTLIVQLSDLRAPRYYIPAYPFLFFFLASAVDRLQEVFRPVGNRIRNFFLSSLILLGIGAHSVVLSLDHAGYSLFSKGYSYGPLLWFSVCPGKEETCEEKILLHLERSPLLSTILPTLSPEDQREVSIDVVLMLADVCLSNRRAAEFSRIRRLIPPGFENHFFYWLGISAMSKHRNDVPKAMASVEFLQQHSAASFRLALFGIYRLWPQQADLQARPESLISKPVVVSPEVEPHYLRALGHYAGRYWHQKDRSLGHLNVQLQSFLPRFDPSVQRYVLQGIGRFLFTLVTPGYVFPRSFAPRELESLPTATHRGIFEGVGMALGESDFFPWISWKRQPSPLWDTYTKGLADRNVIYIQESRKQFSALFERSQPSASAKPQNRDGPDRY